MISCQACGHSNPLGRMFCQKCGTKLDLSKVRAPGNESEGQGGVTVGVRKGEKKGKSAWKLAIRIFDVILLVAVIAAIALVWQEPPVPSILNSPSEGEKLKQEREKLEFAMGVKRAYKVPITDIALNSYLYLVSDLGKASDQGTLRTEKILLVPETDLVKIMYVRNIVLGSWQKRIVMQYIGRPLAEGGDFRFQPVRGSIGKLPVPSFAFGLYERNFARLFQHFSSERAFLGKMSNIQVEPGKVTLVYEPAK